MTTRQALTALAGTLLVALLVPVGASARPPQGPRVPTVPSFYAPPQVQSGPHLVVVQLTPAPATVAAGQRSVLRGIVRNDGNAAVRGPLVVRLLRPGAQPPPSGARASASALAPRRRIP
jgi:hypothetical protein